MRPPWYKSFIIVHPNITRYSKQLRMRIIHNRTIRMIIRLYKAIISINSIMEIYRLCPTLIVSVYNAPQFAIPRNPSAEKQYTKIEPAIIRGL
jgi:hypothetical protein